MALEARGFTRPGRRTLLWSPADSVAPTRWRAGCWCWPLPSLLVARAGSAGWAGCG